MFWAKVFLGIQAELPKAHAKLDTPKKDNPYHPPSKRLQILINLTVPTNAAGSVMQVQEGFGHIHSAQGVHYPKPNGN